MTIRMALDRLDRAAIGACTSVAMTAGRGHRNLQLILTQSHK